MTLIFAFARSHGSVAAACSTHLSVVRINGEAFTHRTSSWIRSLAFSRDGKLLAVACNSRDLLLFDVSTALTLISSTVSDKRVNAIDFSTQGDVLIADKTGRAYQWSHAQQQQASALGAPPATEEQLKQTQPVLMLGHCSLLTDIVFDEETSKILTSDKDHKIRVSSYPKYYNIEAFCLGHTEFVSKVVLGKSRQGERRAVSGSGDGYLRLWDYTQGTELNAILLPFPENYHCDSAETIPLHFDADIIVASREQYLYFISPETFNVVRTVDCESRIFAGVSVDNFLIVSLLADPHFRAVSLSASGDSQTVPDSVVSLVSTLKEKSMEPTDETLSQEILTEQNELRSRTTSHVLNLKNANKRRKLNE